MLRTTKHRELVSSTSFTSRMTSSADTGRYMVCLYTVASCIRGQDGFAAWAMLILAEADNSITFNISKKYRGASWVLVSASRAVTAPLRTCT